MGRLFHSGDRPGCCPVAPTRAARRCGDTSQPYLVSQGEGGSQQWPPPLVKEPRLSGLPAEGEAAVVARRSPVPPSFAGQAPDWPWHRRPPAALPRPGKSREHTHPPAAENGSTHDPSQPNQGQSWDICRGGRGDPISLSPNPSLSLLDLDLAQVSQGPA